MTTGEAQIALGLFTAVVIPFGVSWLKQCEWPDWAKMMLCVVMSIIGGGLTAYATGALSMNMRVVTIILAIFSAATVFYHTWFKALGFDSWLNPVQQDNKNTDDVTIDDGPFTPKGS